MAIEHGINPQFRAESIGDEGAPAVVADHSDEAMRRLRHPFDPAPAGSAAPGARAEHLAA